MKTRTPILAVSPNAPTAEGRELYDYQKVLMARLVKEFRDGARDVLLHAPCGAGKTMLGKAFAAWALLAMGGFEGFHTIVICAPLHTIMEQWSHDEAVVFRKEWSKSHGPLQYTSIKMLEHKKGQSPAAFWDAFWSRTFASQKAIYTCSRALLTNRACMEALERAGSVKGFLIKGDEAHHHTTSIDERGGNRAGDFVEMLLERGGAFLGSTATPWSRSGEVVRKGTVLVRLPLLKYQQQIDPDTGKPFAPQHWEALPIITAFETTDETLAIEDRRRIVENETDKGVSSGLKAFALEVVPEYVKRWTADGCRKVVMRARTVEAARLLVKKLEASTKARGILGHKPRVLNLSGNMSREEKATAQATLDAESKVRVYSESKVDVIVAVVRMDEGTDWRPCSDVYTTGIPGSIGFDIQLCSRGGRGKGCIAGYPKHSENTQRMFYFLPKLDEESRARVMVAYSDLMIAKSLILQSLEAGLEVVNTSASIKLVSRKRTAKEEDAFIDHEVTLAEHADAWHGDLVQNSAAFAKVVKTLARMGDGVTLAQVGEVVENASKGLDEEQRAALMRGAIEHVRAGNPELAKAWAGRERASQYKSASGGYRPASIIRADMIEEWRAFVVAHGERVCPRLDKVLERAAGFNGSTCEEMVGAWDKTWGPWTRLTTKECTQFFRRVVEAFAAREGRHPQTNDGSDVLLNWHTWRAANQFIRLTLGGSLRTFCGLGGATTPEQHGADIAAYIKEEGRTPPAGTQLYTAWKHLRDSHPDVLQRYSIPAYADQSAAMSRRWAHTTTQDRAQHRARIVKTKGATQYTHLGQIAALCARHPALQKRSPVVEGTSGHSVDRNLQGGWCGVRDVPDRCQATSIFRLRLEREANCWRFTLKGAKRPDPRKWADILASGDNKKIETAQRVAFLDWENPDADGKPVRRPWSPPVTQPEAGKRASAKG